MNTPMALTANVDYDSEERMHGLYDKAVNGIGRTHNGLAAAVVAVAGKGCDR